MRRVYIASIMTISLLSSVLSSTAWAKDPCASTTCMWGKLGKDGSSLVGDGCDGPITDFFSIVVKKHGKFKPSDTAKAREKFLKSCPNNDVNEEQVSSIISKFGTMR